MSKTKLSQIRMLIADYHIDQGDRNAALIRRIPHPSEPGEVYLVRFVDAHGCHMSSLDIIHYGAHGQYATEFASAPCCEEDDLLARYMEL